MSPAAAAPRASSAGGPARGRTPVQQRMYEEGRADARAGRPSAAGELQGELQKAYSEGYASVTPASSSSSPSSSSRRTSSSSKRTSSSSSRRTSSRRRAPRPVRNAGRQLVRPVETQVTSWLVLAGMAAGVAFLYNLLRNAETVGSIIDKAASAVRWLDTPSPIPYKHN